VVFQVGDARAISAGEVDALIVVGASQIWGPPVEDAQPLDYAAALTAMRAMVKPGDRVVYGEAIWSAPPTPEAVAPLAGRVDEYLSLAALVELVEGHGFLVVDLGEASQEEWDEFESGFAARLVDELNTLAPDDPRRAEVAEALRGQRAAYLRGYRGILGFAWLCLIAC
jgi:hypothetical protein